ncbi:uncharacterized protein TRIADDRAFT_54984 [Trichoplax adhaerens]|uniref:Uncharacterized protein n=1 Tax=Trichoplax adhaerens TaxID=10228 RepID=B3RQG9_TRIAD|nr:predicted protein [Trichoplax adhaerens]EDV27239.1 predicted protein [Trichoplax adhaerens]|eukprot:XP_002111235.1 predicted protein [Trichoplax adhaerens]
MPLSPSMHHGQLPSSDVCSSAHLQHQHRLPPENPYWKNPHGSSVNVLTSLVPRDPNGPLIYYFYVATQQGFSLIFYQSKIEQSIMRSFLSGCDPVGARVDPVIMDARYEQISSQLYALLTQHMHRKEGMPPTIAFQGLWLQPNNCCNRHPSGRELVCLLCGYSSEERFPLFNLKLVPNTWKVIAHNPDLQGLSFAHAGQEELTVWLHESNSQALAIRSQEEAMGFVKQFFDDKMSEKKLLGQLFKFKPHSTALIKAFRGDTTQTALLTQVVKNAEEYLASLQRKQKQVVETLGDLHAYQAKLGEIEAAQGNPAEVKRLQVELGRMNCPASCAQSTVQIRKQKELSPQEKNFYLQKNLLDTLQLFKRYWHFLPEFDPTETTGWLEGGKALLIQKANRIIRDPSSIIIIERCGFERDLSHHLGDLTAPTRKQAEWLFERFAEYEANFQMLRIAPFADQDIVWLQETVGVLESHLQRSGRLTHELETKRSALANQREMLLGIEPVFVVKRPGVGGEIQSTVVKRFGKDPLETQDEVHIPVGG